MDISGIDCLGLDRVLRRGSGEIITEQDDAVFIRDRISGAYMLACEEKAAGLWRRPSEVSYGEDNGKRLYPIRSGGKRKRRIVGVTEKDRHDEV